MSGWMGALLRSTITVCSGELGLLSSMSAAAAAGGGGAGGGKEVLADRVQADQGVGKVPKPCLTSLSKDQSVASLSSKMHHHP